MRLIHFTDLHLQTSQMHAVRAICDKECPDLVAITGDIMLFSSEKAAAEQMPLVQRFLEELQRDFPVAFCSGNHEYYSRDHAFGPLSLFCADGQSKRLTRAGVTVQVTSFPFDPTFAALPDVLAVEKQNMGFAHKRIWLHHEPPLRSATGWNGDSYQGNPILPMLLKQETPDYLLCGHIHDAPFSGGRTSEAMHGVMCCNPGATEGQFEFAEQPPYILIDLKSDDVVWHGPVFSVAKP